MHIVPETVYQALYGRGSLDLGGISSAGRAPGFHVRCYRRFAFVNRVSFSFTVRVRRAHESA